METLQINVGPLTGISSFCQYTSEQLHEYGQLFRQGKHPEVVWDLRQIESKKISIAGLTVFLAVAHRLRQFSGHAHQTRVRWDPNIFSFWDDISFFRIAEQLDLITWPEELVGGYSVNTTNPNTEILVFLDSNEPPVKEDNEARWKQWKDDVRSRVKNDLILRCGRLFSHTGNSPLTKTLVDVVSITTAELVVNSLLHGNAPAFVGLQRTKNRITVAVSDCGRGFWDALVNRDTNFSREIRDPKSHMEAITTASLINEREFGIRRAIDEVLRYDGWVVMSSWDSEIYWKSDIWNDCKGLYASGDIGQVIRLLTSESNKAQRPARTWKHGLRGVRIAFEIPLRDL